MHEVLTAGGWQAGGPGVVCVACDPKETRMTRQAFLPLYELFAPELARRWSQQLIRPAASVAVD
jgi:hypothetical protein